MIKVEIREVNHHSLQHLSVHLTGVKGQQEQQPNVRFFRTSMLEDY